MALAFLPEIYEALVVGTELEEAGIMTDSIADSVDLSRLSSTERSAIEQADRVYNRELDKIADDLNSGKLSEQEAREKTIELRNRQLKARGVRNAIKKGNPQIFGSDVSTTERFRLADIESEKARDIISDYRKGDITSAQLTSSLYSIPDLSVADLNKTIDMLMEEKEASTAVSTVTSILEESPALEGKIGRSIDRIVEDLESRGLGADEAKEELDKVIKNEFDIEIDESDIEQVVESTASGKAKEVLKQLGIIGGLAAAPGLLGEIGLSGFGKGAQSTLGAVTEGAGGIVEGTVGSLIDLAKDVFGGDFKKIPDDLVKRGKQLGIGLGELTGGTLAGTTDTIKGLGEDIGLLEKSVSFKSQLDDALKGNFNDKRTLLSRFREADISSKGLEGGKYSKYKGLHSKNFKDLYETVPRRKAAIDSLFNKVIERNNKIAAEAEERIRQRHQDEIETVRREGAKLKKRRPVKEDDIDIPDILMEGFEEEESLTQKREPRIKRSIWEKESSTIESDFPQIGEGAERKSGGMFIGDSASWSSEELTDSLGKYKESTKEMEERIREEIYYREIIDDDNFFPIGLKPGVFETIKGGFKDFLNKLGLQEEEELVFTTMLGDITTEEEEQGILDIYKEKVKDFLFALGQNASNLKDDVAEGLATAFNTTKENIRRGFNNIDGETIQKISKFVKDNKLKLFVGGVGAGAFISLLYALANNKKDKKLILDAAKDSGLLRDNLKQILMKTIKDTFQVKVNELQNKLGNLGRGSSAYSFINASRDRAAKALSKVLPVPGLEKKFNDFVKEMGDKFEKKEKREEKKGEKKKKKDDVCGDVNIYLSCGKPCKENGFRLLKPKIKRKLKKTIK